MGTGSVDFFISHTSRDWSWASWLDYLLRQKGYSTLVQGYDFALGKSFVHAMDQALKQCRFVACLLSPAYLESGWCQKELQAGLYADNLVLLRIAECKLDGLLAPYAYADLFDLDAAAARELALAQLHKRLGHDPRPKVSPLFPGNPGASHAPRFPALLPSIWNIQQQRNPYFTGREEILRQLHESLQAGETAALTQAIQGLGGVGKSQLALEYAYRYASEYQGVWWLRAEDPITLAQAYAELAPHLGIEPKADQRQMVREVWQQLSHTERLLLVFDNATEPSTIENLVPTGPGARVIVTTRAQVWPGALAQDIHELPLSAAIELLCKRSGQQDPQAAEDIAKRLGCLPLALEQAAAYVQACHSTLGKYAALLDQHGFKLLERGHAYQYKQTVGTTWSLAFEKLQVSCPAAVDLMHLFLAPDAIHVHELAKAKEHLPPQLAETLDDELSLDQVREALLKYSLIRTDGDAISIHRLVQEVTRQQLSTEERDKWLTAALRAVNAVFPEESDDVRTWPVCALWLGHAWVLVNWDRVEELDAAASSLLLNQAAVYLQSRAEYVEAEPLHRRALDIDERSYGPNHRELAIRLNNLASLLSDTNRLAEAEPLYRRALGIWEISLGAQHPQVATGLNNLALLLRETNRLAEAEPLHRRALDIDERSYGPNHRELAIRLNNLASLLSDTNRLAEAEPLYRRALEVSEQNLGKQHPQVATVLNNLATLLRETNRLAEAEPLYRRALNIDEQSYGPNHPDVAIRLCGLSAVLRDTNRPSEAAPLLRRALGIFEASLGPEHPHTVKCRAHLESLLGATS